MTRSLCHARKGVVGSRECEGKGAGGRSKLPMRDTVQHCEAGMAICGLESQLRMPRRTCIHERPHFTFCPFTPLQVTV
eukprot:1158076-Pelagomonas_calceolata.AAC.12